ncbi:MAG: lysophospholipid acyltransferase family protein [Rhodospirillaceae bacterium]|jgi:lysophospholipid acyltransferase (LPLAT)-like uncharacterized protein|nr:lysophospholipid acyltransferase family protein [Rhodospirillaceae bacterium]MBT5241023.1 lysophospholipid acyltransferase family protein [Rhodospirillaceae bacterium]MBT5564639.1 lysophospholipid acyltransferase family protein [Rhodospirillaceae bacterium]MBT6090974.1 lysophospholipid acyltransferase family protein [Rhodospirillaceae bacterium]MBT6961805.1 lysophospholipid acyltransferase family protein [Rhodospirillaceae bacterium]
MKRLRKALFRNPAVQSVLGALAASYVWLVRVTSRWVDENRDATVDAWAGSEPVIIAFWHNRLFLMPYCWPSQEPFHMLISSHADGRLISKTVSWFNISTVTGSSSKGGTQATRELVRLLKAGTSVGITPDGPRGPRMRAGDGAIALAKLSGATIVPAAVATGGRRLLSTWDKLIVPLPFTRGARVWGTPITVPKDCTSENLAQLRDTLEDSLIAVSNRADALVGQTTIPPADAGEGHHARA